MRTRLPIRLVATWVLLALGVGPVRADAPRALTVEQWREDLRTLAREIPRVHRDAFHAMTRAQFDSAVAALDRDIPGLSDHGVMLGLARIVALVRDGHTRLAFPEDSTVAFDLSHSRALSPKVPGLVFHHVPLQLYVYDDGLFVQSATPRYRRAVGARVLKIGGVPASEAIERVRPLIACDNEMGFKLWAPTRLAMPEVLAGVGLAPDAAHATFALADSAGKEFSLTLEPLPLPTRVEWVHLRDAPAGQAPLWQRHPDRFFWYEYLADAHLLFVQINRISDAPDEKFVQFARRLGEFIDAHPVERVVLDLRRNSGGDGMLNRGLVLTLARSPKIDRPGGLFAIVGRGTFSAAIMLASSLELWTEALFVGEPTGSTPTAYGDPKKIVLPNSGLVLRVSTIYWRDWSSDDRRPWIAPDLPAPLTAADDHRHRDPALDAILDFPRDLDYLALLRELRRRGGVDSAVLSYVKRVNEPRTALEPGNAALRDTLERWSEAAEGR